MKVSICVPIYQTEKYLISCLESIQKQNLDDVEVICVNDGSSDKCGNILQEFGKLKNFKYICIKNSGLSIARNVALSMAGGEYTLFLDSDDLLAEGQLREIVQMAEEQKLDMLLYGMRAFAESAEMEAQAQKMNVKYIQRIQNKEILSGQNLIKLMVKEGCYRQSACGILIRRNFLKNNKLRFYPAILHEDNLFTYHALLLAERVGLASNCLYLRRYRAASIMTGHKTHKNVIGLLVCFWKMLELANRHIDHMNFFLLEPVWHVREYARSLFLRLSPPEKRKVVSHFANRAEFFMDFLYRNKQNLESVKEELIAISDYSNLLEETVELQKKLISVQDKIIMDLNK